MKILSIISITFLVIFAAGCDEMQNQVMKPVMMPDDEVPTEDSTVTSVGTMKDLSTEPDGTKEDSSTKTDDSEEDTSDETETMEEDPPDEPQIPDAAFVSATPASGDISENHTITITFDNDPGDVTVSAGTVSGSGNSRTINGPFSVGSLALVISWTNGSGSHTLNYNVIAEDKTSPNVTTSSTADGTKDVDPETVSENGITVTFSEPISSGVLKLYKDGLDVGWESTISGNTITLTKNTGQELSHGTTYQISGTVSDSTGNETDVSITFTTESEPEPLTAGEGLRLGDDAPDFTLSDGFGSTYTLSDSIGSNKIVIVFFRGGW